jgi:hypothetical protein
VEEGVAGKVAKAVQLAAYEKVGMWTILQAEMSTFPVEKANICSDFS